MPSTAGGTVAILVVGFLIGPGPPRPRLHAHESKHDIAAVDVVRYAKEAYPLWRREHPDLPCPAALIELNPFTNKGRDILDPWGTTYAFTCEAGALHAFSAGEDRKFRTDDDITVEW